MQWGAGSGQSPGCVCAPVSLQQLLGSGVWGQRGHCGSGVAVGSSGSPLSAAQSAHCCLAGDFLCRDALVGFYFQLQVLELREVAPCDFPPCVCQWLSQCQGFFLGSTKTQKPSSGQLFPFGVHQMSLEYRLPFQRCALNRKALPSPRALVSFSSLDATNPSTGHSYPFQSPGRVSPAECPWADTSLALLVWPPPWPLVPPVPGHPAFMCSASAKRALPSALGRDLVFGAGRSGSSSSSA